MRPTDAATALVADVCAALKTTAEHGLSVADAAARLREYGANRLEAASVQWWRVLLRQFASPFVYLLIAAALLAAILGEYVDAIVVTSFLLINAALGFFQEYRSERTVELLRRYAAPTARVLRGGKRLLAPAEELVPGDVVFLETGDCVPADIRIVAEHGLALNESVLSGESVPVAKTAEAQGPRAGLSTNLAYAGTEVVAGAGMGVVVATGAATSMGEIAELTADTSRVSAFETGIARFSSFILKLVVATLVFVFIVNIVIKGRGADLGELVLFSIALAVSVIPEALPVVTTFSLSRGARDLARRKVIVKRLSAIEDLGGIEVLCTDKTGTITENALALSDYAPGTAVSFLEKANMAGAERFGKRLAEPFDIALRAALPPKRRAALVNAVRLAEVPFSPETRLNAVLLATGAGAGGTVIIRGALEAVLMRCDVADATAASVRAWAAEMGRGGKRILAVAERRVAKAAVLAAGDADLLAGEFSFLGAASFIDPIKPTTKHAVEEARRLGVAIKMVTGDAPEVAGAVAAEIGLIHDPSDVITGAELAAMNHHERMKAVFARSVFARITPREKHDIISLLRERASVGFLGEGINDAPALKAADVSLVVQSASDIARDASDIILLQQSLNVIVEGIREGRAVFVNTTKYIRSTLASNFGNFYTVAIVSLFISFLPMLPIQLLLLNLLSDVPLIAIAADRVAAADLRRPTRYDVREIVAVATVLGIVSTVFDFIIFSFFLPLGESALQTNWFIGSLLTELVFVFSIRSLLPVYRSGLPSWPILSLLGVAAAAGLAIPFMPGLGEALGFVRPTAANLSVIAVIVVAYFAATEAAKAVYRRFAEGHAHGSERAAR